MKKFIVNVVEKKVTPFVVEANDEWSAMEKACSGEGYIHECGSFDMPLSPSSWEVDEYTMVYPQYSEDFLREYV